MAPRQTARQRRKAHLTVIYSRNAVAQVVAYGRVSTELQRDAESIKVQVTKLEGTIKVRENPELPERDQLHLVQSFWDDGISGTIPLEERPEGRKLVEMICPRVNMDCDGHCGRTGEITQLWITKLDRLARKLSILIATEAWLSRHGVSLICMDPSIDTSTSTGRLVFTILASISEWEHDTILERTTSGKHQKARDGKFVGGRRTLGLVTDDNGYLVRDESIFPGTGEKAYRVIQSIFENVAIHESSTWKEAKRTGLTERRVGLILHNPRYKGDGGIYDADGNWTAAEKNPPPQLVTPELWDMAQEQLVKNRRNSGGKPHYPYLLSGLLICCEPYDHTPVVDDNGVQWGRPHKLEGLCGRTYSGRIEKRHQYKVAYAYYYCSRTLKSSSTPAQMKGCTAKMMRVEPVEAAVWSVVKRFLQNPGDVAREAASADHSERLMNLTTELARTVKQIAEATQEREGVLQAAERKLRTWDAAEARIAEIDKQIADLNKHRDALELQVRSLSYDELDAKRAAITIADVHRELDEIERDNDVEAKKTLIHAVVKRIEVRTVNGRPQLTATLTYGGDVDVLLTELHSPPQAKNDSQQISVPTAALEIAIEIKLPDPPACGPKKGWKEPVG